MKTVILGGMVAAIALLSACTAPAEDMATTQNTSEGSAPVMVDLRLRDNAEEPYRSVDEVTVPDSHEIGDGMFPYEGIGWENGLVGYRLYLDGRLVSDIFGKQVTDPALATIGEFGSYHDLAPWGMDVLKVGPSLGIGGIGIMRDGEPAQFGSVPELSASIAESGGDVGRFTISAGGIEAPSGDTGGFTAAYSIMADSPMTKVGVTATQGLPLATGIVMHEGAQFWQSEEAEGATWRYIATYGDVQSENKDGLGTALFYRADQASYGGLANQTHFVAFDGAEFEYGFLADWELDTSGVTDRAGFEALLESELARMEEAAQ